MSNISTHCRGVVKHDVLNITGIEQQITIYNVKGAGINE